MSEEVEYYLIICALCVVVSLIWFAIHYNLKNKQEKGVKLSKLQEEWKNASKVAGYLFIVFPIIMPPIMWLFDLVGGVIGLIIIVGVPGALISVIKKG